MAGTKTTRVVTTIAAQVTGSDDVKDLATVIGAVPDETSPRVKATVAGDAEVAGLTADLGKIPGSVSSAVTATVAGDAQVEGLATDLAGLPASTSATVKATVSGDADVAGLAADVRGLPASTSAKVDATVTGDQKVDALVTKLRNTPASSTFTVTANIRENGNVKALGKDIDEVKGKAKGLATSGGAFGAQFLGPFSDSIGLFGDLGEQLANVSDEAGEAGAGGKMKAFGKLAAGLGVTIIAGLAADAIIGEFQKIGAAQAEVAGVTQSLTQTLIDNGNAWDDNAQRALIAQVSQTSAFKDLSAAGIDYSTIMDGLTGQAGGMDKLAKAAISSGNKAAVESLKEAQGLSHVGENAHKAAAAALDYAKNRGLLTDQQKQGAGAAKGDAAAITTTGTAAAGASTKTAALKGDLGELNAVRVDPKTMEVRGDDSDAQRTLDDVAGAEVRSKTLKIAGDDTQAQRVIHGLEGHRPISLEAKINTKTTGTAKAEGDIKAIAGADYEATIHVSAKAEGKFAVRFAGELGLGTHSATPPGTPGASPAPAPAVALTLASSPAPASTYQITINGAIDKDGTARALERLLAGRARRISPTRIGRSSR